MKTNFAFYIHHHGSGHLMRSIAIARQLKDAHVTFLGTDLKRFRQIIPADINCMHLPKDTIAQSDLYAQTRGLDFIHYAPLNVQTIPERNELIIRALRLSYPALLIVDVSVEIAMLAALCGIPTVVIRQNGKRDDLAHVHAYQGAQLLISPGPQKLMDQPSNDWVNEKTFFSGGFSRFSGFTIPSSKRSTGKIAVITGAGGTSIDLSFLIELASQCPQKAIDVLGNLTEHEHDSLPKNLYFHGLIENPVSLLAEADVVIGNAGHNTVMEMAELNKKFICITEERPFEEQICKGALLKAHNMAIVVSHENLSTYDWQDLILKAQNLPDNCWEGVIDPDALSLIAKHLFCQWDMLFTRKKTGTNQTLSAS
ncbi:glycosyltransferase [Dyadobacter sp. CY356]|uniref:glycosyltransferase n=1 Tax=Dyadobacter sp. CY356 TaxID=2906442 RepID=UPI001F28268D|nr:glycosyltransferase [Dyadobacter sp. CY356]MCF0059116.1 hypothetical protein [Dyadobacter sp. CY356]